MGIKYTGDVSSRHQTPEAPQDRDILETGDGNSHGHVMGPAPSPSGGGSSDWSDVNKMANEGDDAMVIGSVAKPPMDGDDAFTVGDGDLNRTPSEPILRVGKG